MGGNNKRQKRTMPIDKKAVLDKFKAGCKKFYDVVATEKGMKGMSLASGILLSLCSILNVISNLNPLHVIVCLYNIGFSALIIIAELKNVKHFTGLYEKIDQQFHLIAIRRGKGIFYIFVGVLAYYTEEEFDFSQVVGIVLLVVGVLFIIKGEGKEGLSAADSLEAPPPDPTVQSTTEMKPVSTPNNDYLPNYPMQNSTPVPSESSVYMPPAAPPANTQQN